MATYHSRRTFLRTTFGLAAAGWMSACGSSAAPSASPPASTGHSPVTAIPSPAPEHFRGDLALEHAKAQMQWIPRHPGTPGWTQCGDYIAAQLKAQGWVVEEQPFEYQNVRCRNIIGKRGSGPLTLIGAHYDTRRRADSDPDPAKRNQPVPGANDGASGIAVLLELARVLKPEELGQEIWLAAFDAEDNGELDGWDWIVGSTYLANNLTVTPQAVIIADMIGDADQQLYYETNSDLEIKQALWSIAGELGYSSFVPENRHSMLDDHTPFLNRNIRAVDIIDFDYPYWHTTADTIDKISAASLEAVGRTLEEWLQRGNPGVAPTATPISAAAYHRA